MANISVTKIASQHHISRQCVYDQKKAVLDFADSLDDVFTRSCQITVDRRLLERFILSISLDGHASIEGIQRCAQAVFGIHLSIGGISKVLQEASRRAEVFDENIPLDMIRQGANDEIFQGDSPVFTGIDPESTYTYLLAEAGDRSADTWELYMEDCKAHGLDLEVSISDGGTGLIAGIPRAFPNVKIQLDVFHALRSLGAEIEKLERKAYALITDEAELEKRVSGKQPWKKTFIRLEEIRPKVGSAIQMYDILSILFSWLKELVGFSGYSYEETVQLISYVLDEMTRAGSGNGQLLKQVEKFRNEIPEILAFVPRLDEKLRALARQKGFPEEVFELMYHQKTLSVSSWESNEIEYRLVQLLGKNHDQAREGFNAVLHQTKRASSLVENLNSRIRVYMDLKRIVPERYFILLKVYFNTKKYRRSRIKSRIGKSPIELMTGKEYPEFLEVLGY